MSENFYITRRTFLEGVGVTTVGLFFSMYAEAQGTKIVGATAATGPGLAGAGQGLKPNVFLHIAPSGLVSIVCHRSEMGQGIRSSLPVLLADELGADMANVKIIQGEGNKAYGDQNTDGSNSVRGIYTDMRKAAATARTMLVAAAAKKLNVPEDSLVAEKHFVLHHKSGRKLSFGELAIAAGELPIPQVSEVKLRPDSELKNVGGKKMALLDGPAYVSGKAQFGSDIRLDKMLIAVIARPAVMGATVKKYNKAAALAVAGVRKVVEMPTPKAPYGFQPYGGIAVIADNTWAAMKGRDALSVTWDTGVHGKYETEAYRKELFASVNKPGETLRNVGDIESALKSADKAIDAEYYVPHLPHVAMEPLTALASFKKENGGSCEVWAPTQNPQAVQQEVGRMLGLPEEKILVNVTMLGGGFGRKSKADFSSEAAFLAREMGVPVRVQWTRSDDIHNDYLNAVSAQKLTAGFDKKGKLVAWRHRTAFPPIASTFNPAANTPAAGDLQQGVLDLALDIPNVRAEACKADVHARIGWLRSVYNIFHAFSVNCFIDELAHAQKKDSKEMMLEVWGPARKLSLTDLGVKELRNYGQPLDRHPVDAGRLRGVLEKVATMSSWSSRKRNKKSLGLAAHRSFNSYTAVAASAVKDKSGEVWIDEVWISIDAGLVINPDRVAAQMEGSVMNGLSYLYYGGVTHKDGAVVENNFDGVKLVRMNKAPRKIHVEIIRSENPPGGVGEPGLPPVAPAAANAIFALTGNRLRQFGVHREA